MGLQQIRRKYKVPARRGTRVMVPFVDRPRVGTVCRAAGDFVCVQLDGEKRAFPYRPDRLTYFDNAQLTTDN